MCLQINITANLLEKELILDINEPETSFVQPAKYAPAYQVLLSFLYFLLHYSELLRSSDNHTLFQSLISFPHDLHL